MHFSPLPLPSVWMSGKYKGGGGDAYITRRYRPRRTAPQKGSFTPVLYTTLSRLLVGSPFSPQTAARPRQDASSLGKERDRYETALQAEGSGVELNFS